MDHSSEEQNASNKQDKGMDTDIESKNIRDNDPISPSVLISNEDPSKPMTSPLRKSVKWSSDLVNESPSTLNSTNISNTHVDNMYVIPDSAPPSSAPSSYKDTLGTMRNVLGKWRKKAGEASKRAGDLAGNTWQHLRTAPSFTDAAMGRIAQGTKVLAEGGYEKIFRQTFESVTEEILQNAYACYLSTSAGPVIGMFYISTAKLAFCSDNPLSYKVEDQTEWSYYKVVIPLHQVKFVNPSTSKANPAEKYIQVVCVDNHEFWFMGFLNYDSAVKCLEEAVPGHGHTFSV